MADRAAIRVVQDGAEPGPVNMARDEALMTRVGDGRSPCTLRLYAWSPPTISLGYFQKFADYEALPSPAGDLAVVRRQTGGGAILHDLELTYAMVLCNDHPLVARDPKQLYPLVHQAVGDALSACGLEAAPAGFTDDSTPTRGPFFCFARRHEYDLLVGDGKIAGSAQRRTRSALLQHGSIIVGNRYAQQDTATPSDSVAETIGALRVRLPQTLAAVADVSFADGVWTDEELEDAAALVEKYAGQAWTRRV